MSDTVVEPASTPQVTTTHTHPVGLYTLFFTEMWERFSYYGMRALLVLFMAAAVETGGLGMTDQTATAIYGLYTAAVYLVALPGGWMADRLLGAQRAVFIGGIIIMLGHFTLAIPTQEAFFTGLLLVVLGTGLLKPNISAIVGELYPDGGARQDAGFTIFYMGINLGAVLGPLVCGTLGQSERFGWHWGFAAAGIGMLLGLIQYMVMRKHLGAAGRDPSGHDKGDEGHATHTRGGWMAVTVALVLIGGVFLAGLTGVMPVNAVTLAKWTTGTIVSLALVYFLYMFTVAGLDRQEKGRVFVIAILFLAAAVFWSGFEQAGSSLNFFADRYTQNSVLGFSYPSTWFQSLNPIFILILAPFFAAFWVNLARRNLEPSIPVKFGIGLILLGLGFLVMVFAAKLVAGGEKALPTWLFFTYLLHPTGELCLSPVGLSSVTKLSPKRFVGQMMGIWFLGASLGNLIAGLLAGRFDPESLEQMPDLYMQIVLTVVGFGLLMLVFTKPIKKLIGDIR